MRQYPTSLLPCLRACCLRAQKFGLHAQRSSNARAMGATLDAAAAAAVGSRQVGSPSTTFGLGTGRYSAAFQHLTFPFPPKLLLPRAPHPIHLSNPKSFLPTVLVHSLTVESCPVEGHAHPSEFTTRTAHATVLKQLVASHYHPRVLSITRRLLLSRAQCKRQRNPAAANRARDCQPARPAQRPAWGLEARQQNKVHLGDREDYESTTFERAWGSSGSHIVIYVPKVQQRKAQVLAALCILLRYTLLPSGRLTLARSLVPSTQYLGTRGRWSRPTDRPSGGDQGWNSIADSEAVFSSLKSLRSIHLGYSPLPGSREQLLRSLPPSFSRHPPARPSFRLCLATFFFLHPGTFTCCTAPFPGHPSSYPHSHLTIKQFQILDWSPLYLLGCYLVPSIRSRPSILETL